MSDEEMQRLAVEAEQIDAELAPPEPVEEGAELAVPVDNVQEANDLITFGVALFVPIVPAIEPIYTQERISKLSAALGPVLDKYGLTLGGIFARWGAEINLLIVGIPIGMETARAIKAWKNEAKQPSE